MKKQKPNSFPVSQRDLAAYLGISSTLLSMTNSGRHGARKLGATQSKKMADLVLAQVESQKPRAPTPSLKKLQHHSAEDCAMLAKGMEGDANHAAAHVPLLRRRLEEMARKYQQDSEWINTVDHLLAKLPNSREAANDRIWLQHQQVIVLKRLKKNGLAAQVKLEVQIEMEKARARIFRDAEKKLLKK